ncbi:MAG: serine dehydratase subunit alpha family protein [Clostridia bacterium]|nr:serine dehydratase subunit alpha family protein [Clostridia bacterium]
MDDRLYDEYVRILHEELKPAMGCTEPIAVAYAGALARKALGRLPERVTLTVSGNIIKNVKSVIVPHTGGRKGLRTAVAAGLLFGRPDKELEALSEVLPEQLSRLDEYCDGLALTIERSDARNPFDIRVRADTAYVRIIGSHTNVVEIRNGEETILSKPWEDCAVTVPENRKLLTVRDIVDFADQVRLEDVQKLLDTQITLNTAIAEEGMRADYGAGIGKILLRSYGGGVQNRAKAYAAAGSDARMNGCEMPVVINSGSGNQGLTASLPVIVYAGETGASREQLYRALVVSNLVAIHLKTGIGTLSAYCGATSAGAGAGAGVAYLYGGKFREIAHTVVNALAINSGMICDGAKSSCAAKIASAVEAGLLGMQMFMHDSQFYGGDGIVVKGVENTIRAVGELAREGMKETDLEIIHLMMNT